jgi:hypothetical protein
MLNRITVIILLISMVAANFSRFFVYAGFELNKKYIAAELCENRDKPWLHCNGHCYFMKKIKQAQDNEKTGERQSQKNLFQETFFAAPSAFKFYNQLLRLVITPYHTGEQSAIQKTLFQPPQSA